MEPSVIWGKEFQMQSLQNSVLWLTWQWSRQCYLSYLNMISVPWFRGWRVWVINCSSAFIFLKIPSCLVFRLLLLTPIALLSICVYIPSFLFHRLLSPLMSGPGVPGHRWSSVVAHSGTSALWQALSQSSLSLEQWAGTMKEANTERQRGAWWELYSMEHDCKGMQWIFFFF